jgi:hypothetical protein
MGALLLDSCFVVPIFESTLKQGLRELLDAAGKNVKESLMRVDIRRNMSLLAPRTGGTAYLPTYTPSLPTLEIAHRLPSRPRAGAKAVNS